MREGSRVSLRKNEPRSSPISMHSILAIESRLEGAEMKKIRRQRDCQRLEIAKSIDRYAYSPSWKIHSLSSTGSFGIRRSKSTRSVLSACSRSGNWTLRCHRSAGNFRSCRNPSWALRAPPAKIVIKPFWYIWACLAISRESSSASS